ncbi:hypothetical protein CISIN_1g0211522mg, partial [Citrus sinensis]
HHEV